MAMNFQLVSVPIGYGLSSEFCHFHATGKLDYN